MKNILVTTDFSENSHNAFRFAKHIAEMNKGEIFLFHSYEILDVATYIGHSVIDSHRVQAFQENMEDQGHKKDESKLTQLINEHFGGMESRVHVRSADGSFMDELNSCIAKDNIDLVVIATKGESNLTTRLFGSNTTQVIRKAKSPVLVIPPATNGPISFDKLVYTTDLLHEEQILFPSISNVARFFDSELTLLHIDDEEYDMKDYDLQELEDMVRAFGHDRTYCEINTKGEVREGISEYVERNKSDMLIMMSHSDSILDRLFHSSMIKQTILHSKIPILTYNKAYVSSLKAKAQS